ncbi:hypothetical protein [Tenacibaculum amylolyticum]|uniref:hypothetical protein n=1 Tax=Tenacibaculum amylolyticum TaxID=104269 RepID=UPI0038946789
MKFNIQPHIGAGELKFKMTSKQVIKTLGTPQLIIEKSTINYGNFSIEEPMKMTYFDNELQITFDNNKVDFIEFYGKNAEHLEVLLDTLYIFKIPAVELLIKITELTRSKYDVTNEEIPYSYIFPTIDLSLWRQVIPELDENNENIADSDEGKFFWSIGIGTKGYYQNS